mgnify:CR=1 FL=1
MDKEDKMRKTITKVVLIICAVSVALGIALCASGVEKALRGIGINVETRIEPNNMYDDYNDDINDFFKEFGIDNMEGDYNEETV